MSLNTTLAVLRTMLKSEVGDNLSVGTQLDSTYNQLLASKQSLLVAEFNFPYMEDRWDVAFGAAGRYASMPTVDYLGNSYKLDYNRPFKVYVFFTQQYIELEYGISMEDFNYLNSDLNQGVDPIQRWRWVQTAAGTTNQKLEVWPIPQTTQTVRFVGYRALNPLAVDADTADVDDELLVLSVAVEILARKKQADSQMKLANATRRLQQLRAAYPERKSDKCVFGGGNYDGPEDQRLAPMRIVAVSHN